MPFSFLHSLHSPVLIQKGNLGTGCSCSFVCADILRHFHSFSRNIQGKLQHFYFFFSTYISLHPPVTLAVLLLYFLFSNLTYPFLSLLLFPPCCLSHRVYPFPSPLQVPYYSSPLVYTFLFSFNLFFIHLSARDGLF